MGKGGHVSGVTVDGIKKLEVPLRAAGSQSIACSGIGESCLSGFGGIGGANGRKKN